MKTNYQLKADLWIIVITLVVLTFVCIFAPPEKPVTDKRLLNDGCNCNDTLVTYYKGDNGYIRFVPIIEHSEIVKPIER